MDADAKRREQRQQQQQQLHEWHDGWVTGWRMQNLVYEQQGEIPMSEVNALAAAAVEEDTVQHLQRKEMDKEWHLFLDWSKSVCHREVDKDTDEAEAYAWRELREYQMLRMYFGPKLYFPKEDLLRYVKNRLYS